MDIKAYLKIFLLLKGSSCVKVKHSNRVFYISYEEGSWVFKANIPLASLYPASLMRSMSNVHQKGDESLYIKYEPSQNALCLRLKRSAPFCAEALHKSVIKLVSYIENWEKTLLDLDLQGVS